MQLDEEVAATAAPVPSYIYTYIAPNDGSTSWGSLIDSIIEDQPTTHTNVVSISWGDCEYPALFPSMRSDDAEFQLAKAAGLTVVAASGDTGSDDCGPGSTHLSRGLPVVLALRDGRWRHVAAPGDDRQLTRDDLGTPRQ